MLYMPESKKLHSIQLLGTVTIGPKGQVVIPADARHLMGVVPGDKLIALYMEDKQSVAFVPETEVKTLIEKMGQHLDALKNIVNN